MNNLISEIQITPVKPNNGLVAFCSFVLFGSLYCSSVAIYTRYDGSCRLVYPTKKLADKDIHLFHPVNKELGAALEAAVSSKYQDVMTNDRHDQANTT